MGKITDLALYPHRREIALDQVFYIGGKAADRVNLVFQGASSDACFSLG